MISTPFSFKYSTIFLDIIPTKSQHAGNFLKILPSLAWRVSNDIQYLNKEEIIADVLREYEHYISVIADEGNTMMFVDKKKYKS